MIPYIRYENTNINLESNLKSPNFPIKAGESYFSFSTSKPNLTYTTRLHGLTENNWNITNLKRPSRDELFTFWESTLEKGYNECTLIDHRNRLLFGVTWQEWDEIYKNMRGGVRDITLNFNSYVPWSLPCIGAYLFTNNNADTHTLNAQMNLTTANIGTDTTIRKNGYVATGSINGSVEYNKQTNEHCYSFFAQISPTTNFTNIIQLERTTIHQAITLCVENYLPTIKIRNDTITDSVYCNTSIPSGEWYDIAGTYDQSTNSMYVFCWKTNINEPFINYMNEAGASNLDLYYKSDLATTVNLTTHNYNNCSILGVGTGKVANAFIFEGLLGSMGFNTLRRLCYYWNNQTESYPK
jgi:hypothetical protein